MNKLDKKQIPQFAALCVLSAGVFGYFVMKIVTPSPAAAGTRPHPAAEASQVSSAAVTAPASPKQAEAGKTGAAPDAAPAGDGAEAPAPTPGMRDPFVVGYVDPASQPAPPAAPAPKAAAPAKTAGLQVASIREVSPASVAAPAVPFGLKGFPALGAAPAVPTAPKKPAAPEAPAAPAWTVTGVLQGGADQVAVLRSGEARRIVRTGDSVDGLYRVVSVTRSAVVLRHGTTFYHLTLGAVMPGAAKPGATAPAPPTPPPASISSPAAPAPAADPLVDARTGPPVSLEAGLSRMVQGALLMARAYMAPAQLQTDTCFASSQAPSQETAQAVFGAAPFDLSRDVYASGQGGAQWRCVTATADLDLTDLDLTGKAGTLPDRFI